MNATAAKNLLFTTLEAFGAPRSVKVTFSRSQILDGEVRDVERDRFLFETKAPSSDPLPSLSVARVTLTGALGLYGPRIQVTAPRGRSELVARLRSYSPYPTSRIRTTIEEAMPGADVVVREQAAQDKLERVYLVTVRLAADGVPGGPRASQAVRA